MFFSEFTEITSYVAVIVETVYAYATQLLTRLLFRGNHNANPKFFEIWTDGQEISSSSVNVLRRYISSG